MGGLYGLARTVGRVAGAVAVVELVRWLVGRALRARRDRALLRQRLDAIGLPTMRRDVGGLVSGLDGSPIPWPQAVGPREIALARGDREYRRDLNRFIDDVATRGRGEVTRDEP